MRSMHNLPQLNLEDVAIPNITNSSQSPSKFNPYSAKYLRATNDSESQSSPIRLKGLDFSPEKSTPFFTVKRANGKRKGSTGYDYHIQSKSSGENDHEIQLFQHSQIEDLSSFRIVPGCESPLKQKISQQQKSPFLKKTNLEQTKLIKHRQNQKQSNSMAQTIVQKHPFFNCKITQSFVDPSVSNLVEIFEQSVLLERSILDSFLILTKSQTKGIQRDIGLAVSLKSVSSQQAMISNEIKILKIIGNNSIHIVKHYNGVMDKDNYIFIRQYYETILRDMIDKLNQETIKELCRQMLSMFQYFTSIKLIYKGNFLTNVCYHGGLYKLRNLQLCTIKKQTSESSLRRKYLGVLREMMKAILGIDTAKPYYSKRLKRDLKPQTIVFINHLIKNDKGFKQLKQHTFLNS